MPWRAQQAQPQVPGEKGVHPNSGRVAEPNRRYDGYFTRATIRYPAIRVVDVSRRYRYNRLGGSSRPGDHLGTIRQRTGALLAEVVEQERTAGNLHCKAVLLLAGLLLACSCGWILYHHATLNGRFMMWLWSDRDMVRAADAFDRLPTTGAELGYGAGARIPGGAYYYCMALPLLINDNPVTVHQFMLALNALGALVLVYLVWRRFGLFAGFVAGNVYLASAILYPSIIVLWNPGFVPLFLILAFHFFHKVIADDKPKALKWAVASWAVALQMHFSILLLAAPALLCLLVFRFRQKGTSWLKWIGGAVRQAVVCLIAVLVVFSPHIVDEVLHGFPNTRLMLQQPALADRIEMAQESDILNLAWDNFAVVGCHFLDAVSLYSRIAGRDYLSFTEFSIGVASGLLLLAVVVGGLAAAAFLSFTGTQDEAATGLSQGNRPVIAFSLLVMAFGFLYYLADVSMLDLRGMAFGKRYLFFVLPAFAILTGAAVSSASRLLVQRGLFLRLLVFCLLIVGAAAGQAHLRVKDLDAYGHGVNWKKRGNDALRYDMPIRYYASYDWWRARLDTIAAETGWSKEDIAGRVAVWKVLPDSDLASWMLAAPINYDLRIEGKSYPGSGPPPGGLLIPMALSQLGSREAVEAYVLKNLSPCVPDLRLLEWKTFGDDVFVTYTGSEERVINSFSNRYIWLPEEEIIERVGRPLPAGTAKEADGPNGESLYVANVDGNLCLSVSLSEQSGAVHATLFSNQLRGYSYNQQTGMVKAPRVRLEGLGTSAGYDVVFDHGIIGGEMKAPFAPLSAAPITMMPGAYSVVFETNMLPPLLEPEAAREQPGTPVSIALGSFLVSGGTVAGD